MSRQTAAWGLHTEKNLSALEVNQGHKKQNQPGKSEDVVVNLAYSVARKVGKFGDEPEAIEGRQRAGSENTARLSERRP